MIKSYCYIFIYNIIQLLALLLLWPVLVILALSPKYRSRVADRLGINLPKLHKNRGIPRIWIHALSLGEAASSRPLLAAIKQHIPQSEIIFSCTTKGGKQYAEGLTGMIDHLVPFPFDIYWIVKKFINHLAPDLFILIETDFWPNILWQMQVRNIPTLLANGRISDASFKNYRLASFLFGPLFNTFTFLSMQVKSDAMRMISLGVSAEKVIYCGNLKYDMEPFANGRLLQAAKRADFNLPAHGLILVAGSTHKGEEEIIIRAFCDLSPKYPLALVIAPRDIHRGEEIEVLIKKNGLNSTRRSLRSSRHETILVLDTLGELAQVYTLADLAFVGGSLVAEGGHNPIEPAILGKTVIFGPHMEDFIEISQSLLQQDAAGLVTEDTFTSVCDNLLADQDQRGMMGDRAAELVNENQGAANRYIKIIKKIIHHAQQEAN